MANYTMNLYDVVERLADGRSLSPPTGDGKLDRFVANRTIFPKDYYIAYLRGKPHHFLAVNADEKQLYPHALTDRGTKYTSEYGEYNGPLRQSLVPYIDHIEQKIMLHYWMREIGSETIDEFIVRFRRAFTEALDCINMKYHDALYCMSWVPLWISNNPNEETIAYITGQSGNADLQPVWGTYYAEQFIGTDDVVPYSPVLIIPNGISYMKPYNKYEENFNDTGSNNKTTSESSSGTLLGSSSSQGTAASETVGESDNKTLLTPYTNVSSTLNDYNTEASKSNTSTASESETEQSSTNTQNTSATLQRTENGTGTKASTGYKLLLTPNELMENYRKATEVLSKIEDELIEALEPAFLQIY